MYKHVIARVSRSLGEGGRSEATRVRRSQTRKQFGEGGKQSLTITTILIIL